MNVKNILNKAKREIEKRTGKKVSTKEIDLYLLNKKGLIPLAGDENNDYEVFIINNEIKISISL